MRQSTILPVLAPVYLQDLLKRLGGVWHCMARLLERSCVVTRTGLCAPSLVPETLELDVRAAH
jgi:hypothetical protein